MDEDEVINKYEQDIWEVAFSHKDDRFLYHKWIQDGKVFILDYSYEHTGGLEGFYVDEYSGTLYINNEAYYLTMKDVFCSDSLFELEKDSEADLKPEDDDYIEFNLNKEEEITMATTNSMNVVTVILMDEDAALKGTNMNIITKFTDVVIPNGQPDTTTLLKLAMDGSVKTALDFHNAKRKEIVNQVTLERTGNKVFLQPIDIEDVTILIK